MTSVTCNVCSQSISAESDRIYCFGGCEQILHIRCSDLSPAGAKAVKENKALKYLCFACRKKQITLNDIQKQCAQLTTMTGELLDCINNNNQIVQKVVKTEIEKNNAVLLSRILSAIKDTDSLHASTPTLEPVGGEIPSYASVVQNLKEPQLKGKKRKATDDLHPSREKRKATENTPTVILNVNDSPANYEEGGLLRSGKRRNVVNQSNSNSNSTVLPQPQPIVSDSTQSQQRKSSTIIKMEQTVLIKPNQKQAGEATKRDISEKLDPVEFAVKELRLKESGEVAIRCENKDLALKLLKSATDNLSENYTISIQKPLKPRLKIVGFSKNMSDDELLATLRKQNQAASLLEINVVRITCNEKRKANQMSAILETDARGFDILMKLQRVNLGWERCRVIEATDVMRCYNCSEYGHKAALCVKPVCCPKCSGDHKIDECEEDREKCINCHHVNAKRQSSYDELLDITHSSWSSECPIFLKNLKKARQRIDFSM